MENIFIINPEATLSDVKDAIEERIAKVKALTSHFLENVINYDENSDGLSKECLEDMLNMINDFLHEIDFLYQRLNTMM